MQKPNELICPACGTELKLPDVDLDGLPKNHFIERCKMMKELLETRGGQKLCDLCRDNETEPMEVTAQVFCTNCSKKLCSVCHRYHKQIPALKKHRTINLDNERECCEMAAELTAPHCVKHVTPSMSHYCFDCKLVTCESCIEEQHQQHEYVDVHEAVIRKREELESQSKVLHDCVAKCHLLTNDMSQYQEIIERQTRAAATAIELRATERKKEIDSRKIDLLNTLDEMKTEQIKETIDVIGQIKTHESLVEAFLSYVEELEDHGEDVEIVCQMIGLQDRASDLLKLMDSIGNNIVKLRSKEVKFRAVAVNRSNLIGELNSQRSVGKWKIVYLRVGPKITVERFKHSSMKYSPRLFYTGLHFANNKSTGERVHSKEKTKYIECG